MSTGIQWTDETWSPDRLEKPLHWKKPRRIFVNSMSDLFHEDVPDEFIDRVFAVMALTPQHTYQILTKRPERMRKYLTAHDVGLRWATEINRTQRIEDGVSAFAASNGWTNNGLPNVWLGTSVEDQAAMWRVCELLDTPAAVRFVSAEPLLGALDFENVDYVEFLRRYPALELPPPHPNNPLMLYDVLRGHMKGPDEISWPRIDWVIFGGESGPHARPCNVEWIRDGVRQCQAAAVPVFVKQLGSRPCIMPTAGNQHELAMWPIEDRSDGTHWERYPDQRRMGLAIKLKSRHGSDPEEWSSDLRIRQFPNRTGVLQ